MYLTIILLSLFSVLAVLSASWAHEEHGVESPETISARANFLSRSKRSLDQCSSHPAFIKAQEHVRVRREALLNSLVREKRDAATVLATSHRNESSDPNGALLFPNPICILSPEVTVGPYWVKGELIREDLRENQRGLLLQLSIQVINVRTCQPVENVYLDIWNCNATGVYAGVPGGSSGNMFMGPSGNGNGTSDNNANLNTTFGRGLQPTHSFGTATFRTFFPGHYAGRVNHIHVMAHMNGTVLPNNTYTSGGVPHIGQIFFDQSLIDQVETLAPYSSNTVQRTSNVQDGILQQTLNAGSDPIMRYVWSGLTLDVGLIGWVTLGIDPTIDHSNDAGYAAFLTPNGGVANANAMGGMGGGPGCPEGAPLGGPGGPGGMPGGMGPMGNMTGFPPGGMGGMGGNMTGMPPGGMGGFPPGCQNGTGVTSAPGGAVTTGGSTSGATGQPYTYG